MATIFKLSRMLDRVLQIILASVLVVMVIVVFAQICVRFVAPKLGLIVSAPWTEEVARYLMIWSVFLSCALATRKGLLIAVDAGVDALPKSWGYWVRDAALACTGLFFVFLAVLGWEWVAFGWSETSPVMSIPMAWIYLAMPVGCVLGALETVLVLLQRIALRQNERQARPATQIA